MSSSHRRSRNFPSPKSVGPRGRSSSPPLPLHPRPSLVGAADAALLGGVGKLGGLPDAELDTVYRVDAGGGVEHFECYELAFGIVVENDSGALFLALAHSGVAEHDAQRIGLAVVIDPQGFTP